MITPKDIDTINNTRRLLRDIAARGPSDYPNQEFEGGKFDEACEAADTALGNVLVIAKAFLGVVVSDEAMYLR